MAIDAESPVLMLAAIASGSTMTRALILLRRRLVGSVFVLLIVVIGTFLLLEAAPGDAVDAYIVSTGGDAGMHQARCSPSATARGSTCVPPAIPVRPISPN